MVKRCGTFRTKTRKKLKKYYRKRGKISLSRYMQEFKEGDRVAFVAEPAYQKGMYFPRFHGKTGTVLEKRGDCYIIRMKDNGKLKKIISHPVHLKKIL